MLVGAHVSSAGGVSNAIKNATNLGIEYLQTFLSAPQSYRITEPSNEKVAEFLDAYDRSQVKGCYAHAIYLLNFASDVPRNLSLSKQNLVTTLNISAKLKFKGVIIHIGSTKGTPEEGVRQVAEQIKEVLASSDPESVLFLENSAGSGRHIGSSFDHISRIIELNAGNPRLKACLDTQHMFAAGYDIKGDPTGVLDTAFSVLGDKLQLIHLNDSKMEFNSKKDRHENIGEGLIGYQSLKTFCTDPRLSNIPLLLEVPGFENQGPDARNIEIVKSFEN